MSKRTVTANEFRKAMKRLGYGVQIRAGTEFAVASVQKDGKKVNGANVFTQDHLDAHREFYDYANSHSIVDNGWRTIL